MNSIEELNIQVQGRQRRRNACSLGDDFAIFEVSKDSVSVYPIKSAVYGFCLCLKGKSIGTMDMIPYEQNAGSISMNLPGQLITSDSATEDFAGICVFMSQRFVENLGLPYDFDLYDNVRGCPVISLSARSLEALHTYCRMVRGILEEQMMFKEEALKHLTIAHFYGFRAYLFRISESQTLSGRELIVKRFMAEVREHYRNERKVSFYAEKLCITPGHLSTVIADTTGRSASGWIDSFVTLEAKALLKSTSMTVQQISDSLNFPSQSFFGKYFRRVTGKSPKEYRNTL